MRFDNFPDRLCQGSSVFPPHYIGTKRRVLDGKAQLLFHGSSLETHLKDFPFDQIIALREWEMKCAVRVNPANAVRKKQVFQALANTKQLKRSVILE
jgi:hypothetical protein